MKKPIFKATLDPTAAALNMEQRKKIALAKDNRRSCRSKRELCKSKAKGVSETKEAHQFRRERPRIRREGSKESHADYN